MMAASKVKQRQESAGENPVRQRILAAAFKAFTEKGYAATSTLEIATLARVSKRELYALVGSKQEMLVACIGARADRLYVDEDVAELRDRETLARTLAGFGTRLLRELTDPAVIAIFRLAIAEAIRAPEVARAVDSIGGEASRAALRDIMMRAGAAGLLDGRPAEMAERFAGLLLGSLMVDLLLGIVDRPSEREIARRAREATAAFLQLSLSSPASS